MYTKAVVVATLLAAVEARFGQEGLIQNLVQGLGNFGNPGQAGTLAGQTPGVLLAGANACAKLQLADQIVQTLGDDQAVLDAAIALVAAEKNTNPFANIIPNICDDASLPATEALRGIVPLVDPAVTGSDVENANSASSKTNPFQANGLSVADIVLANGFSNFTRQSAAGATAPAGNAGAGAGAGAGADAGGDANNGGAAAAPPTNCGTPTTLTKVVQAPAATGNNGNGKGKANENNGKGKANENNGNGNNNNNAGGAGGAADFGLCSPEINFQLGRAGRKPDEGTFLPTDPLVAQGQQDALNPNIITNRICDQLTNVCEANQAAKDLCRAAQDLVQGLGTKDATTADAFNQALGF